MPGFPTLHQPRWRTRIGLARWAAAATILVAASLLAATAADAQPGFGNEPQVDVRAVAQKSVAHPGDPVVIAVVMSHADGFHTWPHEPVIPEALGDFPAIATDIEVLSVPDGAEVRQIQWPEPEAVTVNYTLEPLELISYTGEAISYVPLIIPSDIAPGDIEIALKLSYQACDETSCYWPEDIELAVPIQIAAAGATGAVEANEPELFAGFDASGFNVLDDGSAAMAAEGAEALELNVFGWQGEIDPRGPAGLVLLLLVAALGGLLLNFTPCVLPVIPLKIMGLSQSAGQPPPAAPAGRGHVAWRRRLLARPGRRDRVRFRVRRDQQPVPDRAGSRSWSA